MDNMTRDNIGEIEHLLFKWRGTLLLLEGNSHAGKSYTIGNMLEGRQGVLWLTLRGINTVGMANVIAMASHVFGDTRGLLACACLKLVAKWIGFSCSREGRCRRSPVLPQSGHFRVLRQFRPRHRARRSQAISEFSGNSVPVIVLDDVHELWRPHSTELTHRDAARVLGWLLEQANASKINVVFLASSPVASNLLKCEFGRDGVLCSLWLASFQRPATRRASRFEACLTWTTALSPPTCTRSPSMVVFLGLSTYLMVACRN